MSDINLKKEALDPKDPDDLVTIVQELVKSVNTMSLNFSDFREKEFKPLNHAVRDHMVTKEKLDIFIREQESLSSKLDSVSEHVDYASAEKGHTPKVKDRLSSIEKIVDAGSFVLKHAKIIIPTLIVVATFFAATSVDLGEKLLNATPPVKISSHHHPKHP